VSSSPLSRASEIVKDAAYEQQLLDGFDSYKPKPVSRKLSSKEKNIVSYCEQYYHLNNGQFPTFEQIAFAHNYSIIETKYFFQNQQMIQALKRRGIDIDVLLTQHANTYLSPTQIATALVISNFADTRPFDSKLEAIGVTPTEYYAWLKSPNYRNFVGELADQALDNIRPEAMTAFAQLIRDGDVRALRMYFEMTGAFEDNNETVKNLKLTLARVVESVARHVNDPTTLAKISAEITAIAPAASNAAVTIKGEIEEGEETPSDFNRLIKESDEAVAGERSEPNSTPGKMILEFDENEFDAEGVEGVKGI
jgi:hypothetical protein